MLTLPEVRVVSAGAGSGKTYCLAKRYIQLLINPSPELYDIPLKNILAITFTNKASLEMKKRILELLKKLALLKFSSLDEENDILSSLSVDRKSASRKAHMVMEYLRRNYNFFQVQTIDSFVNSILSGCAFKLELSSNFKIKTDYNDYLEYSLDKLIDRAGNEGKIRSIFNEFLRQYILIENRPGWFPKRDIFSLISSLFNYSNIYGGRFGKYDLKLSAPSVRTCSGRACSTKAKQALPLQPTYAKREFLYNKFKNPVSRRKEILNLMRELKRCEPEGTAKRFSDSLHSFLKKNRLGFGIDDLPTFFTRDDYPVNKDYSAPDEIPELWNKIRKNIKELCESDAYSLYNHYIDIFDMVFDDFSAVSGEDEVIFLGQLNRQARILFDEKSLSVPELYYRLAARFRHYLIDEFQDTSLLQWKNLSLMVEEALSTGGSLFYVGDKKQAIYRFRGGEVSLFDEVREKFKAFNVVQESLSKNFRSQREIVEFNNEIFSVENLRRFLTDRENHEKEKNKKERIEFTHADIEDIVGTFHNSKQEFRKDKTGGYVKVEFINSPSSEELNNIIKDKLISVIRNLEHRFRYGDVAILTRDNDDVKLLTSWLLKEGIPVESEKTLNIRENSLIKELVSFLKFLNSPIDNLAFSSFILGDIFSKTSGVDKHKIQNLLFRLRDKKIYLYGEFRLEFPEEWDNLIEEFFKSVGFVPLYELVIKIIDRFAVFRNFPEQQGFFMRFLELIKEEEQDNQSISSFLEFFDNAKDEDLYVNVTESDSVKVLTIHKSKGLEFGVVITPFLGMDVRVDGRMVSQDENGLRLLRLRKKDTKFSTDLKEIYRWQYKKSFIDELNSIYVALTRARNELYVFAPEKISGSFNIVRFLIPEESATSLPASPAHPCLSLTTLEWSGKRHVVKIPPSEYRDWSNLLKDEFIDAGELRNREKILKGEVLHFILSFIGNQCDIEKVLEEVIEKARMKFYSVHDFQGFETTIRKLLKDDRFRRFFFVEDGDVYQEKSVVDSSGRTRIIDRLIVKQNEVMVLDYKSSRDDSDMHREQIVEYMNIAKDLYPGRRVKGFLIYLDDFKLEEIDG